MLISDELQYARSVFMWFMWPGCTLKTTILLRDFHWQREYYRFDALPDLRVETRLAIWNTQIAQKTIVSSFFFPICLRAFLNKSIVAERDCFISGPLIPLSVMRCKASNHPKMVLYHTLVVCFFFCLIRIKIENTPLGCLSSVFVTYFLDKLNSPSIYGANRQRPSQNII